MKVKAIKDCPNNFKGDVFELPESVGRTFINLGLAEEVQPDATPSHKPDTSKRQYRRRDLVAEK